MEVWNLSLDRDWDNAKTIWNCWNFLNTLINHSRDFWHVTRDNCQDLPTLWRLSTVQQIVLPRIFTRICQDSCRKCSQGSRLRENLFSLGSVLTRIEGLNKKNLVSIDFEVDQHFWWRGLSRGLTSERLWVQTPHCGDRFLGNIHLEQSANQKLRKLLLLHIL